jgi:hypothetical protein
VDRKSAGELQEHMLWTYYGLRVGLAVIGIALPVVVLLAGGLLHHVWLEPSISRYYHTHSRLAALTTRDLFVGGLFAAGACLYLYKGFSTKENVALNLAGIFAVLVAVLPTAATASDGGFVSMLHGTSAVLFFLSIAYVSLFRSRDTLGLLPPAKQAQYARRYLWTGLAMIASPLAAVGLSFALEPASRFRTMVFWSETVAVWTFAVYWIIKTGEMRLSEAEKRTLNAGLKREVVAATMPDEADTNVRGLPTVILRDRSSKSGERVVPAVSSSAQ